MKISLFAYNIMILFALMMIFANFIKCMRKIPVQNYKIIVDMRKFIKVLMNQKNIKDKPYIFVFDLDGTLLHRTAKKIPNFEPNYHANNYSVYLRPNLNYLAHHMKKLSEAATFVLWTSMRKHNAEKVIRHFDDMGLKFEKLYTQQNCNHDLSKDLNIISKDFQIGLSNIYLIDDTPKKRIGQQNFIQIQQFLGTDQQDKQIIRIVKYLYDLIKIQIDQQIENQAVLMETQHKFKQMSINQKKMNKFKPKQQDNNDQKNRKKQKKQKSQKIIAKYQKMEEQQKKQIDDQPKKSRILYKQRKQQREHNKNKNKNKEQKQQQQNNKIKFNENTKVIVFDLSKTLMTKKKVEDEQIAHLRNPSPIQGNIIYNRPYLNILQKLIDQHRNQKQIRMVVWTTMTGKKVVQHCKQVVKNMGVQFDAVINGVQSKEHPGKDLNKICQTYGCKLQNTILVDDSHYKQMQGQNFIHIYPFSGNKDDIEIIRIAGKLDQFIKCQNEQCVIKLLVKQNQSQLKLAQKIHKKQQQQQQLKFIQETKIKQQINRQYSKQEALDEPQQIKLGKNKKIKSQLKQGVKIKGIVFDINQTLITRRDKKVQGVKPDSYFKQYTNYVRPNLGQLVNFIYDYDVKICLFSTIKAKNCVGFQQLLEKSNFKIDAIFSQEHLQNGKKNLQIISKFLQIPLQNLVLVDDSRRKKIEGQNFIQISQFDPSNQQDDSLVYLVSQLKKVCQLKPKMQKKQ